MIPTSHFQYWAQLFISPSDSFAIVLTANVTMIFFPLLNLKEPLSLSLEMFPRAYHPYPRPVAVRMLSIYHDGKAV